MLTVKNTKNKMVITNVSYQYSLLLKKSIGKFHRKGTEVEINPHCAKKFAQGEALDFSESYQHLKAGAQVIFTHKNAMLLLRKHKYVRTIIRLKKTMPIRKA